MVQLFVNPICRRFDAPRFSIAYLFSIITTALTIILPYFLCFSPNYTADNDSSSSTSYPLGLWLKRDSYKEQPIVDFEYKAIIVAQGIRKKSGYDSVDVDVPIELYFSTMTALDHFNERDNFRLASVTYGKDDDDIDGKVDRLILDFELPLESTEKIYGIQGLVFVQYRLNGHVKMSMESLAYVQHDGGLPASRFETRGDLVLRQNFPMRVRNSNTILYENYSWLDAEAALRSAGVENANIQDIIKRYGTRDVTTDYHERYPLWTRDISNEAIGQDGNTHFNLKATIDVPRLQNVLYIPTLYEVLMEAWMRYLSLLIVSTFLMRRLVQYVYTHQVLRVWVKVD